MKWLLCLFSLYVLALSGVPCRSDDDCCMEETLANPSHSQPETQAQHPTHPRPCSPFFACGANHGFVIPEFASVLTNPHPAQPAKQTLYQAAPLADYPRLIWQPPKTA